MKKVYLVYPQKKGVIAPEIYGHFTEHIGGVIYDGIWVGKDSKIPNIKGFRKDIIEKLKAIKAPVIRWPGGCFAETYDWRDGIGKERPVRVNWWYYKDGRYESNEVGTHEFMDFCEAVGADAYFAANLTSVSPLHVRDWIDYCLSPRGSTSLAKEREENGHPEPFNIPYWGVGNENWGGGGNMTPEHYTNEYRRYYTVMKNVAPKDVAFFACGSNAFDFDWTHGVSKSLGKKWSNGYAMHYYCKFNGSSDAVNFTEEEWNNQMVAAATMESIIERNWQIICAYGQQDKLKLVIDEWGCWHPENSGPSKGANLFEQQSTMRDAMVTALTLNIFNNHCEKIKMANVAQLVNNLHALFLSCGEDCITTPTYHVFDMYKEHQGAECIQTVVTDNDIIENSLSVSASIKDGKTLVTIGNLSCVEDAEIVLEAAGMDIPETAEAVLLYNDDIHAHNTFDKPDNVVPTEMVIDIKKPILIPKAGILAIRF